MTYCDDMADFHAKFRLSPRKSKPRMLTDAKMKMRMEFLQEELDEIYVGYINGNLAEMFDGLVDLVYVAIGTAHAMGLPFDEGWKRVHAANMAKVRASKKTKRGTTWDVVKPEGWKHPDLKELLK